MEEVAGRVLDVAVSGGLILGKSALVLRSSVESHFTSAAPLVFLPSSFIELAIWVGTGALAISPVVFVSTVVVAPVCQHHFDLTLQGHSPLVKPTLDNFVLSRVQNAWPVGLVVPPLALVQSTTFELAEAGTMAHITFETALVDVTCARIKGSLATSHVFG